MRRRIRLRITTPSGAGRRASFLLAAALPALACADAGPAPEASGFERLDSAGIEIAISTSPAWAEGEGWEIAEEPSLVLGGIEPDQDAEQFQYPSVVLSLSDGTIVVLERSVAELRAFSRDGEHLWTAGGQGGGPHELNAASHALRLPGDTIVVQDAPRTRYVRFGPDGSFVRDESLDRSAVNEMARFTECVNRLLPDGSLLACVRHPTIEPPPSDPGTGLFRRRARYVRIRPDLTALDTLGDYGGLEQYMIRTGDRAESVVHRFHSRTRIAVHDDPVLVAIATNPAYEIEIWEADGTLRRVLRRPGAERSPTPAELEEAELEYERYIRDPSMVARFRSEMPTPDTVPAIASMTYATTGELVVAHSPPPEEVPTDRRLLDVFASDGRWLGTVDAPIGGLVHVDEDHVLVIRYDELRVPRVERHELRRSP